MSPAVHPSGEADANKGQPVKIDKTLLSDKLPVFAGMSKDLAVGGTMTLQSAGSRVITIRFSAQSGLSSRDTVNLSVRSYDKQE